LDPETGALVWTETGASPLTASPHAAHAVTADSFHDALSWMRRVYDTPHLTLEP
jgi:hypothetical protein